MINVLISAFSPSDQPLESFFHHIQTICKWEEQAYGKDLHREPEELMRCYRKNSSGFILLQEADILLGYADVWQLTPDF